LKKHSGENQDNIRENEQGSL